MLTFTDLPAIPTIYEFLDRRDLFNLSHTSSLLWHDELLNREKKRQAITTKLFSGNHNTFILINNELHQSALYACGDNEHGQLGLGDRENKHQLVSVLHQNPALQNAFIINIAAQPNRTFILTKDGFVYENSLICYKFEQIKYPYKIKKIAAGLHHAIFLSEHDILLGLGSNQYGQLGLDSNITETKEIVPILKFRDTSAKEIMATDHASIVVLSNHMILGTGFNNYNILGLNDPINQYRCYFGFLNLMQHIMLPHDVTIKKVSIGTENLLVLLSNGVLYGCGRNNQNQLGSNPRLDQIEYDNGDIDEYQEAKLTPLIQDFNFPQNTHIEDIEAGRGDLFNVNLFMLNNKKWYFMGAFDESQNNLQRIDLYDFWIDELSVAMRKNDLKTCNIFPEHRLYLLNNGDVYGEMTEYMGPGFAYKGQVAAKPHSKAFLMNTASFFSKKPPIIYEPQTDSSYDFDV